MEGGQLDAGWKWTPAPPHGTPPDVSYMASAIDLPTTSLPLDPCVSYVVVDATQPDCPIVHASDAFLQVTGYARDEVVGHNCRFLQGPRTDRAAVARLATAVREGARAQEVLLNYAKDRRTTFWNELTLEPLRAADGRVERILGIQRVVARPELPGRTLRVAPFASSTPTTPTRKHDGVVSRRDLVSARRRRGVDALH